MPHRHRATPFLLLLSLAACGSSGETASPPVDAGSEGPDASAVRAMDGGTSTPHDGGPTDGPLEDALSPSCPSDIASYCPLSETSLPTGQFGGPAVFDVERYTVRNPAVGAPGDVTVFLPDRRVPSPVLFYSHAYGSNDVAHSERLFERLAGSGFAVVYVPYRSFATDHEGRYRELALGFRAAAEAHEASLDLTRVGFLGHSYGGGATPEMARRAVELGWGEDGMFLFSMAPWYSWGEGYAEELPDDLLVVVQVYWDDDINDHAIARDDVWARMPEGAERVWQVVRTASCGCRLYAGHGLPVTIPPTSDDADRAIETGAIDDAFDRWVAERQIEAAATYALADDAALRAEARAVLYGETEDRVQFLAHDYATPALEVSTEPVVNGDTEYQYPAEERCENADEPSTCEPLPTRE